MKKVLILEDEVSIRSFVVMTAPITTENKIAVWTDFRTISPSPAP